MRAIGIKSVTTVALISAAAVATWQMELMRADYWEQLSPWVTFLAAGFAVLAGMLIFRFWRLGERSEYYLRFGERLPFGAETALGPSRGRTLLVGHASQVEVLDFPPVVQRGLWITIVLAIGLITVTNRAVALLRDFPDKLGARQAGFCKPPEPPKLDTTRSQGCRLVERAYQLGYAKSLGSCGPQAEDDQEVRDVCRLRQLDEPYLHYAWRLLDTAVVKITRDDGSPGLVARLERQFDHLGAMFAAQLDTIAMEPRSSHHVFTNLPDPRASLGARVDALLESGCGARLARLPHFPRMDRTPAGPSRLLEHVLAQLLLNPIYRPTVAQCEEIIVHWDAAPDACERLAANPRGFLEDHDALDAIAGVLAWRRNKEELAPIAKHATTLAPPARIISLQCLIFDEASAARSPIERTVTIEGEELRVRETRMKPLTADGASQIRLYKHLAALLSAGFGYGRLTSNQAVGARPEEVTMAASFREPAFLLTKLDLLRDADLFLGNDWLAERPDLLDVYPYHLHLENFVEIFRRQYKLERGRL